MEGNTFCIIEFESDCQVPQWFLLYHFPCRNSTLNNVLLSVTAYSNGWRSLGLLVLWLFCLCVLANSALVTFSLSEPGFHNYHPSVHNSTFISTFMHGPSVPYFGQKLLLLSYLWFIFWYHLLWFLFLSIREICFPLNFFTLLPNMQISRFSLIIYNPQNWSASSTLISPDEITPSRDLTC